MATRKDSIGLFWQDLPKEKPQLAYAVSKSILKLCKNLNINVCTIYPVPRGGVPAAYAVLNQLTTTAQQHFKLVDDPDYAHVILDDIIDSGETKSRYIQSHPAATFLALVDKDIEYKNYWVVFPWEHGESKGSGIEDNIRRLLQFVGEDSEREGLLETPARVAKAWTHWASGYNVNIPELLKVFEDGADGYDEMVVVRDILIYSKCEHHLASIFGTATIAYIPNGRIVGLSKLSRVADAFARRLQVQERLTAQIADALDEHLKPKGVGVIVKARHMCMESRGICQQGHHTITSALRGCIKTEPCARAEFLNLAK